ncbi:MAG TPA: nucleotide exchange factor GrpE [Candidatus Saccharimonadales bacterium]|nr:nucleotide exchange factor GrpE [Candidatus Saccharimonadales bacterium]
MSEKKKPKKTVDTKVEELTHDLQRLQAEFANYKRREAEAKAEVSDFAIQQVVAELLPLFDNLDRALGHRPADLEGNAWADGVEAVSRQVGDALKALGVEKIQSLGQAFDHNLHEAVAHEGDGETVIEELQPGYKMGERVIRHALVRVGSKK